MTEKTKTILYNIGIDLAGWVIVIASVLTVVYLTLPLGLGFYGGIIIGAVVGFIVSLPVNSFIEKHKR